MSLPFASAQFGPTAKSQALSRILFFEAQMHRRMGLVRPQRYLRLWNYYAGTNLPPNNVEQPLGVNYIKEICDKHTSFFWGDFKDRLVDWAVRPRRKEATPEDATAIRIRQYLDQLLDDNNAIATLWNAALDGSVFGDSVFRLRWGALENRVMVERLIPEFFHCRWDTADYTKLTEVIVAYPIDRGDAYEKYGTQGNNGISYAMINPDFLPGMGIYWEHWTAYTYRIWIDDMLVQESPNPYMWSGADNIAHPGIIPFIHIPNMPVGGEFYGFGDAESALMLQDDLNRRLADMGDTINNHAHPIVTVNNFHGDQSDLAVGPDALWDLGLNGKADIIEAKGNPMAKEYVEQLMSIMFDTVSLPEVAFGHQQRSNGRAQASATALQMMYLPAVARARRKRVQWTVGLQQLAKAAFFLQQVYDADGLGFAFSDLTAYTITPAFAPILPKDQLQKVNENVALAINGLRSVKRALEDMGEQDIDQQIVDIKQDAVWRSQFIQGGKNSEQGQGGSPLVPGGPGAHTKPGAPAKDVSASEHPDPTLAEFEA